MGITNLGAVSMSAGGVYNPETEYKKYKVVSANGGSYMYINSTPATGVPVTDTSHWQQIASVGGQDLVDAAVAARDAAQGYKDAAANSEAQLQAGIGSPARKFANLAAVNAANPAHDRTYLTEDDWRIALWDEIAGAFVAGGVYQATSIADGSVTPEKTSFLQPSTNLFDKSTISPNKSIDAGNGSLVNNAYGYGVSDFIPVQPSTTYFSTPSGRRGFYTSEKGFISSETSGSPFTTPITAYFIRIVVHADDLNTFQVNVGSELLPYESFDPTLKNINVNWDDVSGVMVSTPQMANWGLKSNVVGELLDVDFISGKVKANGSRLTWGTSVVLLGSKEVDISSYGINEIIYIYYDTLDETVKALVSSSLQNIPQTAVFMCLVRKNGTQVWGVDQYLMNGVEVKKTTNFAYTTLPLNGSAPQVDIYNKKVTFFSGSNVIVGRRAYTLSEDKEVSLSGSSAVQSIYFDTSTFTFRALFGADVAFKPNEALIMVINFSSVSPKRGALRNVLCLSEYTILRERDHVVSKRETIYDITPFDFVEPYKGQGQTWDDFSFDPEVTSVADYYSAFNSLVENYPEYVTVENLGLDSSGLYPVYQYTFTAPVPGVQGYLHARTVPKILIACGLHGGEKISVFSLYYFVKDLLENWENNAALEYLRHHVDIVMIPVVNPWGHMHNTRKNSNGVDLNRNGDYLRINEDPSSDFYQGASAFSEVETQYVKAMIDDNLDAVTFIDYHTNGSSGGDYNKLFWYSMSGGELFFDQRMINACKYQLSKMTRVLISDYSQPDDEGFMGYIDYNEGGGGVKFYAEQKGIPSIVVEGFRKFPSEATYYSGETVKANTENIGNWLVTSLKYLK